MFATFAVLALVAAVGVVVLRDPIKGAMSLIVVFFSLASLFVLQRAELIAMLEVLVYAGAIMVLFVFVLMLVEDKAAPILGASVGQRALVPVKVLSALLVGGGVAAGVAAAQPLAPEADLPAGFGGPAAVGLLFFERYLFHFEMTGVLLLGAIAGAVAVSRRTRQRGE